jgi:hypothetical protein
MAADRRSWIDPDKLKFPQSFSFTQEDLDRIDRIQLLKPMLNNKSKVVLAGLAELETSLRRLEAETLPSTISHQEVLEYLYRFTLENSTTKYNLASVSGVVPHHRAGSNKKRIDDANSFIESMNANKDNPAVSKLFDEYLDNVEFILWAHAHIYTSEFMSKLPVNSKEEIISQIFVALLIAKADPGRPLAQRFMHSYADLSSGEHLQSLKSQQSWNAPLLHPDAR